MATKAQLERKAARTGCELFIDGEEIALHAPEGFTIGEYHIMVRTAVRGWSTKADIYDEMVDELDDIRRCPPDCTH